MMTRRRLLGLLATSAVTITLVACTVTQSLDYLQQGAPGDLPETGAVEGGDVDGGSTTRTPVVVVPDQTKPGLLAQDSAALYWVAAGKVFSASKAGGPPRQLGVVPASTARHLAADPSPTGFVFVAVGTDIVSFAKDGSDAGGVIFKGPTGAPATDTVVADDDAVFVLQYDDVNDGSRVFRMAKDGGAVVDVVDSGAGAITTSATSVFWIDPLETDYTFFEQSKTAPPGPPIGTFPLGQNDDAPASSRSIAVDDQFLYWATDGAINNPAIVSRKREPTASVLALYRGAVEDVFGDVAIDGKHVYFIETSKGTVARVVKEGGPAEILATGLQVPSGLVVDATHVYVSVENTGTTGAILSLTK